MDSPDERRDRAMRTLDEAKRLLLTHDMAGYAALFAPDGVLELPISGPQWPDRVEGRDAVTEYLANYTDLIDVREVVWEQRHPTVDPDTVVFEFETSGVVVPTQEPFTMRYIAVITVGDEGITTYRDYWSSLAALSLTGGQDALDDAFGLS